MTTLLGILAVILTVAIVFGRRVAQVLVLVAAATGLFLFLCMFGYIQYEQHVREARMAKVRAVMARVPAAVSEDTRRIFEQEVEAYLNVKSQIICEYGVLRAN
jgi:hypothetical protein